MKHMRFGGDMEDLWIMFDYVKRLKDWTTMTCHAYASEYCEVFTTMCCDINPKISNSNLVLR